MRKNTIFTVSILFALLIVLPALAPEKAAAASTFSDGEYTVPFTVLKDTGNEQSTTAEYMVSPAKVIVQNDKVYAVVTLTNSSWWQYFKVQATGGFADVQVLSNDTANDKRVVKFEVKDIDQLVNAKIHVIVTGIPGFTYDNKYDIRFKFNSSKIPLAPVAEKPATPPASKPTPKPSVTEKVTTTQKSADNKIGEKQEAVTKMETEEITEMKTEEKASKSKEIASEKSDANAEEKTTESAGTTDQLKEDEPVTNEEIIAEDQEVTEKSSEVTEDKIEEEIEVDSTSRSNSTLLIVIFFVLVLGGAIAFIMKKRSQTEK